MVNIFHPLAEPTAGPYVVPLYMPEPILVGGRSHWAEIYGLGDIHDCAAASRTDILKHDVAKIAKNPNAICFGMGDYYDAIGPNDHRFASGDLPNWLKLEHIDSLWRQQVDHTYGLLEPIAHTFIALIKGNHEIKVQKLHHVDMVGELAAKLSARAGREIPVFGKDAYIGLRFKRGKSVRALTVRLFHGWSGGRKPGSRSNMLVDAMNQTDARLTIIGHGHKPGVEKVRYDHYNTSKGRIDHLLRYAVMSGTYLARHSAKGGSYASEAGYAGSDLGVTPILFHPDKNVIRVVE